MLAKLTAKQLKDLIRELKAHHNIVGFSRMKKHELVAELNARFILEDGRIYLKGEGPSEPTKPAPSKKELTRQMNKYFYSQDPDEIVKVPIRQVVAHFEAVEDIRLDEWAKSHFKDLARKYLMKINY